ncbi:uncharacterized protein LOC124270089 [Haliotis rubra]|uniref:uncharacterized protein LOC124270089 n=1 Tax=Haliotis rubra TaxID=36100 RepID=UPI001EE59638|nr:uncharacterized protein LOC124270089 [Haliotis rubra]
MMSESFLQQLFCLMVMVSAENRQELYSVVRGYRLTNPPMLTVHYTPDKWSAAWCLQQCLASSCASASFSQTEGTCELHSLKLYGGNATFEESDDWVYMEPSSDVLTWDGWTVVFRGQKDTGTSIYSAWLNDNLYHDHPLLPPRLRPGCFSPDTSRPCEDHFRSKIMSTWETAGIQLVKVLLMKNSQVRNEIIFDGTGTTKMSWFTPTRVINSTWTDLTTSTFNVFRISGEPNTRRFQVSHSYAWCHGDVLWMVVVDGNDHSNICFWDNPSVFPKLLYTIINQKAPIGTLTEFEYGDIMAILVKQGN